MVSIPFAVGFDNLQYYWKKYFTLLESSVGYSEHGRSRVRSLHLSFLKYFLFRRVYKGLRREVGK